MGVHHVTSNVPITYYFPSVHNSYMCQGLSSDYSNTGFSVYKYDINVMFHSQGSVDAINKCISGQLEELAGVLKLELYKDQLYIKVEGI